MRCVHHIHAPPPPPALSALTASTRRLLGCFERVKKCHLGVYGPRCMTCMIVVACVRCGGPDRAELVGLKLSKGQLDLAVGESSVNLITPPLCIHIEAPTKGRGGCSRMTVSPTASSTSCPAGMRWLQTGPGVSLNKARYHHHVDDIIITLLISSHCALGGANR